MPERRWIGGRRWDLAFFFGSSAAAVALGLALVAAPALVVPLWWLWIAAVDGPHLAATWARTYLDGDERRRRRTLLAASLLFLLPGPLALAVSRATGTTAAWDLFLALALFWSWHHNVRQHYGIMAIYERLDGASARDRRIDAIFLQASLWLLFALFMLGHPLNQIELAIAGAPWLPALLVGLIALQAAGLVAYLIAVARRTTPRRPALFVLGPVIAMQAFVFLVVGAFEPLVGAAGSKEERFLAVTLAGGLVHGLQYLGIVFAANRRRYRTAAASAAAVLGRSPPFAYAALFAVSLAYAALVAAHGGTPAVAFFPEESDLGRLFLGVYWGLFFHHYYLDQRIWHPGRDPRLAAELGMREAA